MLILGDCLGILPTLDEASIDAVVTDPPYDLLSSSRGGSPRVDGSVMRGFMGMRWDGTGVAFNRSTWESVFRVLKPSGYMFCFGGTRTYHRLACAVEDAGFEIRDCLMWLYGSGFPKGDGCLKPAYEPVLLCRRPGPVLPLGIDECRIELNGDYKCKANGRPSQTGLGDNYDPAKANQPDTIGRWPANVAHDGSDEVMAAFAEFGEKASGQAGPDGHKRNHPPGRGIYGGGNGLWKEPGPAGQLFGDSGSAARFFYCAKASGDDRAGNDHPTVKPVALMEWLVKLVCPMDGVVIDPMMGSGSTGVACLNTCRKFIGIEKNEGYFKIAQARLDRARTPLFEE